MNLDKLSVIIPTFQREQVLLDTIESLLKIEPLPSEILIIDQTRCHEPVAARTLTNLDEQGKIRWLCLSHPSITHAMNTGLLEARSDIALFLDDDILPDSNLISAHLAAHNRERCNIVAGQVLQPGEEPTSDDSLGNFLFRSNRRQTIQDLMAGNFSIKRKLAIELGGFDENFVRVAYRFESEFADRAIDSGEMIFFEPAASIRHLKTLTGGTRFFGEHLKTVKPSHTVGAYYYFLCSRRIKHRFRKIMSRSLRSVRTRHHLHNPWWIPLTLVSEFLGLVWAVFLFLRGPRYVSVHETVLKR